MQELATSEIQIKVTNIRTCNGLLYCEALGTPGRILSGRGATYAGGVGCLLYGG